MKNISFSRRATQWSILPTAALHGKILELQHKGEHILDLTIGISNVPIPKLGEKAALSAIEQNNIPYTAIGGSKDLKQAIKEKLARDNHISCETDSIIVSTGAKQAIFEALYALTDPGDEVLLFQPYWPAYTQIATILDLQPHFLELDEIPSLATKTVSKKTKLLILNNPHNPSGKLFTKSELEAIAAFAKKHNLYVLSDESYEELVYEGEYISFHQLDESISNQVITVFSVSQSFSMMGWRLGYAVAHPQVIHAMEAVQGSITAGASAVTQTAVTEILNTSNEYITVLVNDFGERRKQVYKDIARIPWLTCELPASGPYFWCNIQRVTKDSIRFCEKFLEKEKIAIMPGEAFGAPGWVRIAFNVQPTTALKAAIVKLSQFGEHYV